ncbi:MAG: hypothetical protein K2O14_12555 [Oscillospiraceae bacterium]|nr:hypothetical protein [Oscillospiraceae bacterium]
MADFSDRYGIVFQNLIDAGFDSAFAEEYARLILNGKTRSVLKDLGDHRKKLLDEVHINQKRIDCLDYLIYKIEKSEL